MAVTDAMRRTIAEQRDEIEALRAENERLRNENERLRNRVAGKYAAMLDSPNPVTRLWAEDELRELGVEVGR